MTDFDPTTNRIPFELLTPEEQAILKAWPHGFEFYNEVERVWEPIIPTWGEGFIYRGKPASVVKEHFVNVYPNSLGNAHPSKHEAENEWPWGGAVAGMIRVEIVDGKLKDVRVVKGDET